MNKEQTCSIGTDYYSKTRLSNAISKEQALRILKLLSALESYAFCIEKFMPDYLHDELITIVDDLESIVLDKPIENDFLTASKYSGTEYTNPHKHNNSLLQSVALKETK